MLWQNSIIISYLSILATNTELSKVEYQSFNHRILYVDLLPLFLTVKQYKTRGTNGIKVYESIAREAARSTV